MNRGVCHRIVLKDVYGKLRHSYRLPEIRIWTPDLSDGIVEKKGYWRLYIKPLIRQLISASPFISIYNRHAHAVKITTQRFEMVDKSSDPCVVGDPTQRFEVHKSNIYSSLSCSLSCVYQSYKMQYACAVLNLDTNFTRPLNEYCNTYYWNAWSPIGVDSVKESEKMKCINECPHECNMIIYDSSVDTHQSKELIDEEEQWRNHSSNRVHIRNAKIYFINGAVLSGGIVTYQEVFTYSFETLVGNIGGTCGIWIGVSIMTLIQLFMFFLEQTLKKGAKARLKTNHVPVLQQTENSAFI